MLARGRKEEAINILRKVAKENKAHLTEEIYASISEEDSERKAANMLQVFRYPRLRLRAINIFFNW